MTRWPRFAWGTILALLLGVAVCAALLKLQIRALPLVERYDFPAYLRTSLPAIPFWHGSYTIVERNGRMAVPDAEGTFQLVAIDQDAAKLHADLEKWVYHASVWWVLKVPLGTGFLVLVGLLFLGGRIDQRYSAETREGHNLRGPELVTVAQWNKRIPRKDRWISIQATDKYWISRERIAHHVAICGVNGTRKTHIVRQLAYQFRDYGIPCVFLDLKREFIQEFWQPGDWILDPGDMRCPYWELEAEVEDEMRAMALAYSAFPDEPRDQPFFKKNPRSLLAYLLGHFRPPAEELAEWLSDDRQIDNRVKGSDVAGMLTKEAGDMRGGILATLKEFGRSLRLWPTHSLLPKFSVKRWAAERKGNIFIASTPGTFDALRPVQSMLLDMLLLAMQDTPGPGALLLEEIGRMGCQPKLESSISLQRAAGNPIVLTFQELSQLKAHYGDLSKAIVSQPYTQLIFRTSEEEAARHGAGILGQAQLERIRESRQAWSLLSHHPHRNYQQERVMEYVVTPGQIQSLEDGHGFLAQAGAVAPLHIEWKPPVIRAEKLIPRIQPTVVKEAPSPTPIAPTGTPKPYRVRRKLTP